MSVWTGELIYRMCSALASIIGLAVPVVVVLWLVGRASDQQASAVAILASFAGIILWAAGRVALNAARRRAKLDR